SATEEPLCQPEDDDLAIRPMLGKLRLDPAAQQRGPIGRRSWQLRIEYDALVQLHRRKDIRKFFVEPVVMRPVYRRVGYHPAVSRRVDPFQVGRVAERATYPRIEDHSSARFI